VYIYIYIFNIRVVSLLDHGCGRKMKGHIVIHES